MHNRKIDTKDQIQAALNWAFMMINKGLEGGSVEISLCRYEENRTVEQNSKQWPMYQDFANQIEWHGQKLSAQDWKSLLSHEYRNQKIVPALGGGFCVTGLSTSKLKKREFADLIEVIYMWGANLGVVWSEPSLKSFEQYREAQQ